MWLAPWSVEEKVVGGMGKESAKGDMTKYCRDRGGSPPRSPLSQEQGAHHTELGTYGFWGRLLHHRDERQRQGKRQGKRERAKRERAKRDKRCEGYLILIISFGVYFKIRFRGSDQVLAL